MAEILKERSELDPQFQWDLTPMLSLIHISEPTRH